MQLPLLLLGVIQESHTLIIHGWPKISVWSLRPSKSTCTKTLIKSSLLWRIRDRCNIQTCWKALLRLIKRLRQSSFMKTREAYRRVKKSSSTTKSKWVETTELHAPCLQENPILKSELSQMFNKCLTNQISLVSLLVFCFVFQNNLILSGLENLNFGIRFSWTHVVRNSLVDL